MVALLGILALLALVALLGLLALVESAGSEDTTASVALLVRKGPLARKEVRVFQVRRDLLRSRRVPGVPLEADCAEQIGTEAAAEEEAEEAVEEAAE